MLLSVECRKKNHRWRNKFNRQSKKSAMLLTKHSPFSLIWLRTEERIYRFEKFQQLISPFFWSLFQCLCVQYMYALLWEDQHKKVSTLGSISSQKRAAKKVYACDILIYDSRWSRRVVIIQHRCLIDWPERIVCAVWLERKYSYTPNTTQLE